MWFKDLNEHSDLVKPVAEIKPFLQEHYEKFGRQIMATTYSMLHYRYVMTLTEVSPAAKLPTKPTSLRLLESDAGGAIAIHEVSLNKKEPELLETFYNQAYLKNFQSSVLKMKTIEPDETKGEIRNLSIPALNVDTLWLSYDEKPDEFISIWDLEIKPNEVFSAEKFLAVINDLKYKLNKANRPKGA
jgi:hypothetical protein